MPRLRVSICFLRAFLSHIPYSRVATVFEHISWLCRRALSAAFHGQHVPLLLVAKDLQPIRRVSSVAIDIRLTRTLYASPLESWIQTLARILPLLALWMVPRIALRNVAESTLKIRFEELESIVRILSNKQNRGVRMPLRVERIVMRFELGAKPGMATINFNMNIVNIYCQYKQ